MKRDKYLQEIYELTTQYGFSSMRMEEIAEKIGITKMTIYNNFSNKETLYKAIISHRSSKFLEFISNATHKHDNAVEELIGVLEFQQHNPLPEMPIYYVSFLKSNPRVFNLYKAKFRRMLKIFVANNITRGIKEGIYLSSVNPEQIANFTISTMDNMMDKWLKGDAKMNLNITHEHIIHYHLRGIVNPAGQKLMEHYLK